MFCDPRIPIYIRGIYEGNRDLKGFSHCTGHGQKLRKRKNYIQAAKSSKLDVNARPGTIFFPFI